MFILQLSMGRLHLRTTHEKTPSTSVLVFFRYNSVAQLVDQKMLSVLLFAQPVALMYTCIYVNIDHLGQRSGRISKCVVNCSAVHGISTFIILSYTQYTLTSSPIANQFMKRGRFLCEYYMQGSLKYFLEWITSHMLFQQCLCSYFSLFLSHCCRFFSYPLLWRIKAKCRHNKALGADNDVAVWPICKLLPLINSFRGGLKDNHCMFTGLLFL